MDPSRDLPQISQENPRVPSSPELDDQLFHTFFDWPAYLNDTAQPWDKASQRATPQHLDKLITDIHPLIDTLEAHRFFRMKTSFGSDDGVVTSSDYSHPSPPDLVLGEGSTSPSDHSGPALLEQSEEPYRRLDTGFGNGTSLNDVRAHDDKWTYPQADVSNHPARVYSPQLRVSEDGATRHVDQGLSLKRGPSGRIPGKRPRQLENPEQTADVRKSGACLPCRVSKTRVSQ